MKQIFFGRQRGQSLVEVAVFLPVALIIIAGLVEMSLYLVTQNKVTTASREAARFGANGGEDAGMVSVALSTVTQTLQLEIDRWDMWTVRGKVRARCLNGTGGTVTLDFGDLDQDFDVVHSYGISATVAFTDTTTYLYSNAFRQEVLQELSLGGVGNCNTPSNPGADINNLQFVGMYTAHDVDSILGLDVFLENVFTVRALQVFRVTSVVSNNQTDGCSAFPLALDEFRRSVNPSVYTLTITPTTRYPATNFPTYPQLGQNGHVADHSLANQANEGDVFLLKGEGRATNNFTSLQWNTDASCAGCTPPTTRLANSWTWPGNSLSATLGFHHANDWTDASLNIGDMVAISSAPLSDSTVWNSLRSYVDRSRTIRLILWKEAESGTLPGGGPGGSNVDYIRVAQFVNVRLLGFNYSNTAANRWVLVQFVNYDTSCGQVAVTP